MSADRMPISRGIALLADIPDREGGDGGPELVIRDEHPVIAMPVLPRRRHEIGQPVQEVKRREFDDAIGSRPGGRSAAAGPDPGRGFVSREHVADADDAAVGVADHGEPVTVSLSRSANSRRVWLGLGFVDREGKCVGNPRALTFRRRFRPCVITSR